MNEQLESTYILWISLQILESLLRPISHRQSKILQGTHLLYPVFSPIEKDCFSTFPQSVLDLSIGKNIKDRLDLNLLEETLAISNKYISRSVVHIPGKQNFPK